MRLCLLGYPKRSSVDRPQAELQLGVAIGTSAACPQPAAIQHQICNLKINHQDATHLNLRCAVCSVDTPDENFAAGHHGLQKCEHMGQPETLCHRSVDLFQEAGICTPGVELIRACSFGDGV